MELVHLNPQQFERFRDFIYRKSGIRIPDNKLSLLSNRIRRRLTAGRWSDFDAYYDHLTSLRGAGELEYFFDAVTTNETAFFRTPDHFDWFSDEFLKNVVSAARRGERPQSLRIWSAGCASGAEPYTVAICLLENLYRLRGWEFGVLGTDISEDALRQAREGVFRPRAVEGVTEKQRKRYFRQTEDDCWQVRSEVADLVTFEHHNLMMPAPTPAFDCVFIRNVLIYFDAQSKEKVVRSLIKSLVPGGFLVVGPSEGLYAMLDPLQRRSTFLYEKLPVTPPPNQPTDAPADDMSDYLQMFMDETEEQLEGLVQALLVLEEDADDQEAINDAFRLIHSIKGSAGMMGFENIALLTHRLESRFELFRSRVQILDNPTMNLVLRCIDFLRECIRRMRSGAELGPVAPLLEELGALEASGEHAAAATPAEGRVEPVDREPPPAAGADGGLHVAVHFEPGLPLVDLKARLIHARLSKIGDVLSTRPMLEQLDPRASLACFELMIATDASAEEIREAADADGVTAVEIGGVGAPASAPEASAVVEAAVSGTDAPEVSVVPDEPAAAEPSVPAPAAEVEVEVEVEPAAPAPAPAVPAERTRRQPIETMRVDVERLDNLMNLAGELVVNRARFVQISDRVTPALRSRHAVSRARDFTDSLRDTIAELERASNGDGEWRSHIEGLTAGLELMEGQAELWESGRRSFVEIGEAIDQLTRVSDSLQRSVLGTRMVPVAPLFNRFKRVVRDLSSERGKHVNLVIQGEKTELDKRMIDELGDPLVHLVRNSIDHGLESPEVRESRGKPAEGTIRLSAHHSGNSVFIEIHDDGGGIELDRIRAKILEKGLLGADAVDQLSAGQALDYIWDPGFSTAQAVTDISGRGVGMDAVRTRITELNGTIDVDTTPTVGTVFTIRLPLTLAIINSLLIRIRGVAFSMPIEDVREIVAVQPADVVSVHGRETIDVRGQFIPLIGIDDVFDWHDVEYRLETARPAEAAGDDAPIRAVVLQAGDKTMGLRVDELIGSEDLVIKSLSQNFVHIRGLSGASILGDGAVCLMLDVSNAIDQAVSAASRPVKRRRPSDPGSAQ